MQINPRFGRIVIFGFLTVLLLGGTVYGVWTLIQDARLPNLTESEIQEMISVGMSEEEVAEALGQPNDKVESDDGSGWIYHNDPPAGYPTRIFITFRKALVSDVLLKTPRPHYPQIQRSSEQEEAQNPRDG